MEIENMTDEEIRKFLAKKETEKGVQGDTLKVGIEKSRNPVKGNFAQHPFEELTDLLGIDKDRGSSRFVIVTKENTPVISEILRRAKSGSIKGSREVINK